MLLQKRSSVIIPAANMWSEEACLFPPPSLSGSELAAKLIIFNTVGFLTEDELARCRDLANRLCEVNRGRPDARHYDRAYMQDDYFADTASNGCELVVANYVEEEWHARVLSIAEHIRRRKNGDLLPDVGKWLEVRRVRNGYAVAVRRTDLGKIVWAVLVPDDTNLREYCLVGWVNAADALASPRMDWREHGERAWGYYPLPCLNSPESYFTR